MFVTISVIDRCPYVGSVFRMLAPGSDIRLDEPIPMAKAITIFNSMPLFAWWMLGAASCGSAGCSYRGVLHLGTVTAMLAVARTVCTNADAVARLDMVETWLSRGGEIRVKYDPMDHRERVIANLVITAAMSPEDAWCHAPKVVEMAANCQAHKEGHRTDLAFRAAKQAALKDYLQILLKTFPPPMETI